jgi:hypothetical protein
MSENRKENSGPKPPLNGDKPSDNRQGSYGNRVQDSGKIIRTTDYFKPPQPSKPDRKE